MKLLFTSIILMSLMGCINTVDKVVHPKPIVYTSSWSEDWKKAKLKECEKEVVIIVLSVFETKIGTPQAMTNEDV